MSKDNKKCLTKFYKQGIEILHPELISVIKTESSDDKQKNKFCVINKNFSTNVADMFTNKNIEYQEITEKEEISNIIISTINLDNSFLLSCYKISDIDSLKEFIESNLNFKDFEEINRILNFWILENLKSLKKFNYTLFSIIKKILLKFTNIPEKHLNKELENYIDYWVNKKNSDDFYFNLIDDFKKYLNKKYGEKN